jgi:hypothetical protein
LCRRSEKRYRLEHEAKGKPSQKERE